MKALNLTTLVLLIVGGLNWGLVGFMNYDLVASISGGADTTLAHAIYGLVGLSALWQLVPLSKAFSTGEVYAETH